MANLRGIYSICDNTFTPGLTHGELAQKLLQGGISLLQLRMKGETDEKKVLAVAREIQQLKRDRNFTFIVNDFVSVAHRIGADGVHLGQDDMGIRAARKLLGPDFIIGYSSHAYEEALQAEREGADYVALGAIFPTKTKGPGHPVVGLETLARVTRKLRIPVVAIGGIDRKNINSVINAGAQAVAMISALNSSKDISAEAKWFNHAFQNRIHSESHPLPLKGQKTGGI